jgi:ubiquitin-protein ligase
MPHSPGPEELLGYGDISQLSMTRSCSEEALQQQQMPPPMVPSGYGLTTLFRTESEEKQQEVQPPPQSKNDDLATKPAFNQSFIPPQAPAIAPVAPKQSWVSKLGTVFSNKTKSEKKAEKLAAAAAKAKIVAEEQAKAAAAAQAEAERIANLPKSFVDDRPRFGLAALPLLTDAWQRSIVTMPMEGLLVVLGELAGVSSVRKERMEKVLRDAQAKVREVEKLEAEMKRQKLKSAKVAAPAASASASASAVPAKPVVVDSNVVLGENAPVAPALNASSYQAQPVPPSAGKQLYWAKGTGYGHSGSESNWSLENYLSGLQQKEQQMQFVCRKISDRLIAHDTKKDEKIDVETLAESSLMPFIESYLCNDSMNEILEQRATLYTDIFSLVGHLLAVNSPSPSPFLSLLTTKVQGHLKKMCRLALLVEKTEAREPEKMEQKKLQLEAEEAAAKAAGVSGSSSSSSSPKKAAAVAAPVVTLTSYVIELSQTLDAIVDMVEQQKAAAAEESRKETVAQEAGAVEPSTERENSVSCSSVSVASSVASEDEVKVDASASKCADGFNEIPSSELLATYKKELSEHRFGEVEEFAYHKYMKESKGAASSAPISRTFTRRLAVEYADLADSLPIHFESSVWMRVHESHMQYAQMLISGPVNTPYQDGLFLFDVAFPSTYPAAPPQVNLQTTGKGAVRFNPNLYNCGKVCLSILGTWGGGVGEGWMPKTSTMLQVAVSIQSLIFVEQPFFNEPSYESTMHTPEGQKQSEAYSQPFLHDTLRWAVLDQLQNPPKGFEDVVKSHFRLKKERILKQAEEWAKKNPSVTALIPQLKAEFAKLA